jgi:two-component system, LytTR family, response regulator
MKLRTFIADDEPHALALLEKYIALTPGLEPAGSTLDPLQALEVLRGHSPPEIVFLDIDMPVLSGITLAASCSPQTSVVFTTSYREYGPEAFEQNILDYLLKPFSYERFLACIEKARSLGPVKESLVRESIFVKGSSRGKLLRIRPEELIYLEGAENFVYLHTPAERILTYSTLQELAAALPAAHFLRIHKSYIINLDHIVSIESGQVRMDNQALLPLGRVFSADFHLLIERKTLPLKNKKPG